MNNNIKIKVRDKEESIKVQKILIGLGCWWDKSGDRGAIRYTDNRYLYVDDFSFYRGISKYTFNTDKNIKIDINDLIKPLTIKIINGVEYC